jgi:hypothetical protein
MANPQNTKKINDTSFVNNNPTDNDVIVSANKSTGKLQTIVLSFFAKAADLLNKPNKVTSPVANNIKVMDASGNDVDSGKKITDLEPAFAKNTAFNKNYSTDPTKLKADGTATIGIEDSLARIDHIHPSDTTKIDKTSIENSLISTDATKVLSANQGKILQDGKIDKTSIENSLISTDATKVLSANQGKILKDLADTKANATDVNTALALKLDKASVVNNLTSTSTTDPVSAAQVKLLNDNKLEKSSVIDNLTTTSTTSALSSNQGKVLKDLVDTKANTADIATLAQGAVINNGVSSTTQTYSSSEIEARLSNLPQGGGSGISYYVSNTASDISTYNTLDTAPLGTTGTLTATANNNTVLLKSFATSALNRTLINGGFWEFNFACSIDSNPTASKISNLVIELYRKDGSTETLINTINTEAITSTSKIEVNATLAQQQTTITATTRIVVKIYAKTTETKNVLFTLFFGNTDSHIHTPFKITKDDIGLSNVVNADTTLASNVNLDGIFTTSNTSIVAGDSLKTALQKAQGQVNDLQTNKQNNLSVTDSARIDLTLTGSNLTADIINGSINTNQLADNGVTTTKILNANVTDSKIANGISTSKMTQATFTDNTSPLVDGDTLNNALNKIQYQAKDAFHKNTSNEINTLTQKTNIIDTDTFLAEDSGSSFLKARIIASSIWNYIKGKDLYVRTWYVSNLGSDSNNGFSPNNALLTLANAITKLGNTGEALVFLLGQLTESITFNQLNIDVKGDNANRGASTGTSGTVTSANASSSQRYSNLAFGSFTKTGAGQAYLRNTNITGTLTDSSSGYLEYNGGSIGNISIAGTGIKVFENFDITGTVNINNALVSVSMQCGGRAITLATTTAMTLTAGTLSLRNAIIYCPANTVFGASGFKFLCDNVQFIDSTTGLAQVITIASGTNYSLQNCEYDQASTLNGVDISSTRIKRFFNIFAKLIDITTATIQTLSVKDKTILLNSANSTDASADGSGLNIKGATNSNKTFLYNDTRKDFTSSENINVPTGKNYYIGGTLYADTAKTFTNTTIAADNNTNSITGIKNANIASDASINATKIGDGSVTNQEFQYINTLAANAQDQFNNLNSGKQNASATLTQLSSLTLPNNKYKTIRINAAENGFTSDFAVPSLTTTERDALASPVADLIIYNETDDKFQRYNGTAWDNIVSAGTGNVSASGLSNISLGEIALFGNPSGTNLISVDGTASQRRVLTQKTKLISSFANADFTSAGAFSAGAVHYNSDYGLYQGFNGTSWLNILEKYQSITTNNATISNDVKNAIITPTAEPSGFVVNLPPASAVANKVLLISIDKAITRGYYGARLIPASGTIDGASSYDLAGPNDYVVLIAIGNDWKIAPGGRPSILKIDSVTTTGMTTGSQCNLDYVFSSKYSKYLLHISNSVATNSGSYTNSIKFRTNGANDAETGNYICGIRWIGNSFQGDSSPALGNQIGGGSTNFFNYSGTTANRAEIEMTVLNPRQAKNKSFVISGDYLSNNVPYNSSGSGQNLSSSSFDGICYIQNGGSNATTKIDVWAML